MILGIYCAGGFGGVVYELAQQLNNWESICFIDDGIVAEDFPHPIFKYDEFKKSYSQDMAEIIIASGEPRVRDVLFNKVNNDGYQLPNLISEKASFGKFKKLGKGNILLDFSYFSGSGLSIGNNNIFMPFSLVSHNCVVHDHVVVSGSANINGGTILEDRVYVGSGSIIREMVKIGADSIIGMGSVVTKNVENNSVMVGIPAKVQRKNLTENVFKAHGNQ